MSNAVVSALDASRRLKASLNGKPGHSIEQTGQSGFGLFLELCAVAGDPEFFGKSQFARVIKLPRFERVWLASEQARETGSRQCLGDCQLPK
jgi:hypothetical protein